MSEETALETSFDLLAWREALANGPPVASAIDLTDWTHRLALARYDAASALLGDVAAIQTGFSPGMWGGQDHPFGRVVPVVGDDMWARAMTELRRIGTVAGASADRAGDGAVPALPALAADVAETAGRLRCLLEQPLTGNDEELARRLKALAAAAQRLLYDHRVFASASLQVLVPAIAAVSLADFVLRMRPFWSGPLGSSSLFHLIARLDVGGLGPYIGNVDHLARNSRDVIAMARIACDSAAEAGAMGETATPAPWIALLAVGCGPTLFREIVDDLGDAAAADALMAILDGVASRPATTIDVEMVLRLRDVGLDNANYALATRAQEVIVRLRPESELETMILGSIQASGGQRKRAKATFLRWLARSPGHEGVRERLAALEENRFDPFVIERGFGSPTNRQALRLHQRGALPNYLRRRGERINAVQVH